MIYMPEKRENETAQCILYMLFVSTLMAKVTKKPTIFEKKKKGKIH